MFNVKVFSEILKLISGFNKEKCTILYSIKDTKRTQEDNLRLQMVVSINGLLITHEDKYTESDITKIKLSLSEYPSLQVENINIADQILKIQ